MGRKLTTWEKWKNHIISNHEKSVITRAVIVVILLGIACLVYLSLR